LHFVEVRHYNSKDSSLEGAEGNPEALIYFPPVGRKKFPTTADNELQGRNELRGRNELIAEKLLRWTGEFRTRKQVSSHIQVLKAMVKDDPFSTF
jgi:hypothetical protein